MMLTDDGDGFTLAPDLVEALGIDDYTKKREYGRERGLNPNPTSAQVKDIDKLNQKLNAKLSSKAAKKLAASTNEDDDVNPDSITFDIKSKSRVILFEAPLLKRSMSSMIQHHSKRIGYLLNDALIITTLPTTSTSLVSFNSVERITIQQIFYLDQISITDLVSVDPSEENSAFEIRTPERPYIFLAESEADKKIWLEELEAAIFSILSIRDNKPGWFHEIVRGTFHSAAFTGDIELVTKYISRLSGQSLDKTDESGMTPLHWASLNGFVEIVDKLISGGAEVDHVNGGLNSSLLLAAAFGHRDVIFSLLDHGADISLRNLKDHDCLMMSVTYGSYGSNLHEIIMALKYRGIDVNRQDISGATPLHECSSRSLPLSIQALVDAGADVNCKHGRTGLTPLQLACSSSKPDAETIRSLLDKGASPNWRDTMKRSAFDMLLFSKQISSSKNNDTTSAKGMKQTVDDVQQFVQVALPALVELVRKGTRFSPESIEHLRDSFKEVLNSTRDTWKNLGEPDGFVDFVRGSHESIFDPKAWTPDSSSQCCLLCLDKFTYSSRRHHCRTCGILCCDVCSIKRLHIKAPSGPNSPPSSSSKKDKDAARVCDSCFNRFNFLNTQYHQNLSRMKKEIQKREQEEASKQKLIGGKEKESPALKSAKSATAATAQTTSAMNDTMKALEERGQRLENTAERSEQMREAASEFRQMTKQLLRQQQQKSGLL